MESTPVDLLSDLALPPVQEMIEELGDLGPPAGDEKKVQAIIEAFEDGVERLEANPANVSAGVAAFENANKLSEQYGLVACRI